MIMQQLEISSINCKKLSDKIKNDFFIPVNSFGTSVFLCGANVFQKENMRHKLNEMFNRFPYFFHYKVIYPEDIFEELLYSPKSKDLLSLENLLAESVDAVVVIPESPGSLAELGAFASNTELRKKIVCVLDNRYKKSKSFISKGPVKLIKNENKGSVVFIDPDNIYDDFNKIISAIKKVKKRTTKKSENISLLHLDSFLLPVIYLLEPIQQNILIDIVKPAIDDSSSAFELTSIALTILTKGKYIELTPDGYKLTDSGFIKFQSLRKFGSRTKIQDITIALDELRLEFLNLKLRNKELRI